jgi:hypothetical protein
MRQGALAAEESELRVLENKDYLICPSYPLINVVPLAATLETMVACSNYRTKNRFPSLSYFDRQSGCSIFRTSQTKVKHLFPHLL